MTVLVAYGGHTYSMSTLRVLGCAPASSYIDLGRSGGYGHLLSSSSQQDDTSDINGRWSWMWGQTSFQFTPSLDTWRCQIA